MEGGMAVVTALRHVTRPDGRLPFEVKFRDGTADSVDMPCLPRDDPQGSGLRR